MGGQIEIDTEKLASALEQIHPNYAYHMLLLQINLYSQRSSPQKSFSTTNATTQLTQLYMKAVEVLEDKYSQGFQYFNWKIQSLLKNRSIIEELLKQNKCSTKDRQTAMQAIKQTEINQRREDYNIRMSLQTPTIGSHKVKELIKNAEMRINMIESKIQTGLLEQTDRLESRIKLRKMKSVSSIKGIQQIEVLTRRHGITSEEPFQKKIQLEEEHSVKFAVEKGKKFLDKKGKPHLFGSFTQPH